MTRAAIYARFSSARQREESIADQVRVCTRFIMSKGWEVAKTYSDEARSGTEASHRPGFLSAMDAAQRGAYDVLVVYKQDRFARNRYDAARYKMLLRRAGVELVSATEGVPEGPEGIILESVLEGMAEYYSANLAQNVRRGMEGNALKCRHNGVHLFGYECAADGSYEIDPATSPAVLHAFEMAADGARKSDIAAWLNSEGFVTVRGKRWGVEAVTRMLGNRKYAGVYSWGSVEVDGGMPAIVSGELFERAAMNVSKFRKPRTKTYENYLLTGKLYDEDGNRFECNSGRSSGNGRYYYYYRCLETGVRVRRDEVEDRVRDSVRSLLVREEGIEDEIVQMVMEEQERQLSGSIERSKELHDRREELSKEIERLIDLAARSGATSRIAARIDALSAEDDELAEEIIALDIAAPVVEEDMVRFMLQDMVETGKPDSLIAGFVDRVVIDADGGCVVCFNLLKKQRTPEEAGPSGVRGFTFGRPRTSFHELFLYPYPGGFAIAA